jgi:hypothetical protein
VTYSSVGKLSKSPVGIIIVLSLKHEFVFFSGSAGDELIQKKKHKKKKGKLPKNTDPDSTVDPERWLPKRERSYYRGKRKDKRKEIGKGPQGATSGSADQ